MNPIRKQAYPSDLCGICNPIEPMKTCTTHHFACDCREAKFKELLQDVMDSHSSTDNGAYNACEIDPCSWCIQAGELIGPSAETQNVQSVPPADEKTPTKP